MTSISINSVSQSVGHDVGNLINDVKTKTQNFDASNPQSLLDMQVSMMNMQMAVEMQAATAKSMKEAVQSITQRMS